MWIPGSQDSLASLLKIRLILLLAWGQLEAHEPLPILSQGLCNRAVTWIVEEHQLCISYSAPEAEKIQHGCCVVVWGSGHVIHLPMVSARDTDSFCLPGQSVIRTWFRTLAGNSPAHGVESNGFLPVCVTHFPTRETNVHFFKKFCNRIVKWEVSTGASRYNDYGISNSINRSGCSFVKETSDNCFLQL